MPRAESKREMLDKLRAARFGPLRVEPLDSYMNAVRAAIRRTGSSSQA